MIAFAGAVSGYNGEQAFSKPRDSLSHIDYGGMRQMSAVFGSLVIPLSAMIVQELSSSTTATLITAVLVLSGLCDLMNKSVGSSDYIRLHHMPKCHKKFSV